MSEEKPGIDKTKASAILAAVGALAYALSGMLGGEAPDCGDVAPPVVVDEAPPSAEPAPAVAE